MIRVRYERTIPSMAITGHAKYAEPGQDIVCAAASALLNTVVASLRKEDDKYTIATADRQGAYVSYVGKNKDKARCIMDTVHTGYACIAEQYPENIRLED